MADEGALERFIKSYDEGSLALPLGEVLGAPDVRLDELAATHPAGPALVRYVDAFAYGTRLSAYTASRYLMATAGERLGPAFRFDGQLLDLLMEVRRGQAAVFDLVRARANNPILAATLAWLTLERDRGELEERELVGRVEGLPPMHRALLELQLRLTGVQCRLARERPLLFDAWGRPDRPHAAVRRRVTNEALERARRALDTREGQVPLIFLDALDADLSSHLAPLAGRPALFYFLDVARVFAGALAPAVLSALLDPAHVVLVADGHPEPQLAAQPGARALGGASLVPVVLTPSEPLQARTTALAAALAAALDVAGQVRADSPAGNLAKRLGRDALEVDTAERLGAASWPALGAKLAQIAWYDAHKGAPPPGADLGPPVPDYTALALDGVAPLAPRRRAPAAPPFRLAHVIGQLVDGSHAPSRLFRTLVKHHDRARYELSVVVTENAVLRVEDYPPLPYVSASTAARAPRTLAMLAELGVPVVIDDGSGTLAAAAARAAVALRDLRADVAVFHGPDFVHTAAARASDVPLRVMFEHGTLPQTPGYDVAVASADSAEAVLAMRPRFAEMGTALVRNPHVVDAREDWQERPPTKPELGFAADALLMTTISNHLDARLGDEMCGAIAAILKRCPKARYAPIGPVRAPERLLRFFSSRGVGAQVTLLGPRSAPSQLARAMDLYLNEFPFGGGIALLDALAAGCPIVSMHDDAGPPQGKYAGTYFGMDRVVRSGRVEDYVDLACRLLEQPQMLAEWQEAALRRYEEHTDPKRYVRRLEEIIEEHLAPRADPAPGAYDR